MQGEATTGREVRLVDIPVALYQQVQQHTDAVLRELVLMAEFEASAKKAARRMRPLFERANAAFAERLDVAHQAGSEVDAARERGEGHVTLTFTLPERYAAAAYAWTRLMDEIDALCRDGTMLTVPASEEAARFGRWWCREFTRQLRDGAPPMPWPQSDGGDEPEPPTTTYTFGA